MLLHEQGLKMSDVPSLAFNSNEEAVSGVQTCDLFFLLNRIFTKRKKEIQH